MPTPPSSVSGNVWYWDASQLTGQTDGQPISGTAAGFGADGSNPPATYSASLPEYFGKPGLSFNGSQWLSMTAGDTFSAMSAAVNGGDFSYEVLFSVADTAYHALFSQAPGFEALRCCAMANNGRCFNFDGVAPQGTYGLKLNTPYLYQFSYKASTQACIQGFYNGLTGSYTYTSGQQPGAPGANTPFYLGYAGYEAHLGSIGAGAFYNVPLTAEQMYMNQVFYKSYLGSRKHLVGTCGDSRTFGTDTTGYPGTSGNQTVNTRGAQLAAKMGSNWSCLNFGVYATKASGQFYGEGAPQILEILASLSPMELENYWVSVFFGVNDYLQAPSGPGGGTSLSDAATPLAAGINYLTALAATNPAIGLRINQLTEIDQNNAGGGAAWDTWRTSYQGLVAAALNPSPVLRTVNLTTNPYVGQLGTSADPTRFCADELHPCGEDSSGTPGGGQGDIADVEAGVIRSILSPSTRRRTIAVGRTRTDTASTTNSSGRRRRGR